jgi:hypothetical protein
MKPHNRRLQENPPPCSGSGQETAACRGKAPLNTLPARRNKSSSSRSMGAAISGESPRQSQAYNSALVTPPDGQAHTILRIASTGIRSKGRTLSHRVSRTVQSTLTRLITGHAFIGAYRLRFRRKSLPPATEEEVACACGAVPEDTEHVLLHCPLTHDQRLRHLSADGVPPDSLRKLFDSPERCLGLLRFLDETRICARPRSAWEPG